MNTYIVADGGGTKTEFMMFDDSGRVLACARQKGSNALFIDPVEAAGSVEAGIRACMEQAGVRHCPPHTVMLFIPGFAGALPIFKSRLELPRVELLDDIYNAYYGALAAPYGIVALAGTGSFVVGRAPGGDFISTGGWGPLFGDEGSGYHLGVMCLQATARLHDLGMEDTPLVREVLRYMDIKAVPELRAAAYATGFTREKVAGLSHAVQSAAEAGDEDAAILFDRLAEALADQVAITADRICADSLPVSVAGGMVKAGDWFTGPFSRAVERKLPGLKYTAAKYSPLVGGALYLLAEQRGADGINEDLARRLGMGAECERG